MPKKSRYSPGMNIGRLLLLHPYSLKLKCGKKDSFWYSICECGNTKITRSCALAAGASLSCGCLRRENAMTASIAGANVTRKYPNSEKSSHIYKAWRGMWNRVQSKRLISSRIYRYRGIVVCEEWRDFYAFKKFALGNGYIEGLTVDRIDNYRGYEPKNVRFVTMAENLQNRRPFLEWSPRIRKAKT